MIIGVSSVLQSLFRLRLHHSGGYFSIEEIQEELEQRGIRASIAEVSEKLEQLETLGYARSEGCEWVPTGKGQTYFLTVPTTSISSAPA